MDMWQMVLLQMDQKKQRNLSKFPVLSDTDLIRAVLSKKMFSSQMRTVKF